MARALALVVLALAARELDALQVLQADPLRAKKSSKALGDFKNDSAITPRSRSSACDGRSPRALNCDICMTNVTTDRPTLYVPERGDGCGARLHDIIMMIALANANHVNFGGVISSSVCHTSHGVDVLRAAGALLGLDNSQDLFIEHPPKFDLEYSKVEDFQREFIDGWWKNQDNMPRAKLMVAPTCGACQLDHYDQDVILGPKFLAKLRDASRLPARPDFLEQGDPPRPIVALHVRRGDVTGPPNQTGRTPFWDYDRYMPVDRFTPDDWYFQIVERIRQELQRAEVHVFSSTERRHKEDDFIGYKERHMEVHLDGDILDAWAVLSRAQVLVMAKSSFSHVAAFLNPNCVLYQPYWHKPLSNWIVARDAQGSVGAYTEAGDPFFDGAELRSCLKRV